MNDVFALIPRRLQCLYGAGFENAMAFTTETAAAAAAATGATGGGGGGRGASGETQSLLDETNNVRRPQYTAAPKPETRLHSAPLQTRS